MQKFLTKRSLICWRQFSTRFISQKEMRRQKSISQQVVILKSMFSYQMTQKKPSRPKCRLSRKREPRSSFSRKRKSRKTLRRNLRLSKRSKQWPLRQKRPTNHIRNSRPYSRNGRKSRLSLPTRQTRYGRTTSSTWSSSTTFWNSTTRLANTTSRKTLRQRPSSVRLPRSSQKSQM